MNQSNKPQSIYHPTKETQWIGINWSKVEKTIEKLQHRITKATEKGERRKVRHLQRLLNRSISARVKAVQIVAQENPGKLTPGIDGETWTTPSLKHRAALELRNRSKTKPLKRVYISKLKLTSISKGTKRPLGIPCISDRARQALWNLSTLPAVEATSDPHNYGFRPFRDCWDANAQIRSILAKQTSPRWVLDAAIEKGFDKTYHDWLLENTPMETKVLRSWLKAGFVEGSELFPTEKGTAYSYPQGGVISTLANFILNGIENHLKQKFKYGYAKLETGKKIRRSTGIHVIRYADAFIVTGRSKRQLERVKEAITEFLKPRGLNINDNKTRIKPISQGFDFLGWHFRRYPAFICTISNKSISRHRKEIKYLTKTIHSPLALIDKINSKAIGWMNYHRCCNRIWRVWSKMNSYLFGRLMKWGLRRHSNKTKKWVFTRYWKHKKGRWTFTYTSKGVTKNLTHYNFQQKRTGSRISSSINTFDMKNRANIRQMQLKKDTNVPFQKRHF